MDRESESCTRPFPAASPVRTLPPLAASVPVSMLIRSVQFGVRVNPFAPSARENLLHACIRKHFIQTAAMPNGT